MKEYTFTIKLKLNNPNVDAYSFVDDLCDSGCGDAIVGIGKNGFIALTFTSFDQSLHHAIFNCAEKVLAAIPGSEVVQVKS